MKTLAVINPKGGTGKTTVATHIAAAFAVSGLKTALADLDRQKGATAWLKRRPDTAASIKPLNWARQRGEVPKKIQRLIMDCPAQIRSKGVVDIIRSADVVVVPTQAAFFDEVATMRFLGKIGEIRKFRKGRAHVLVVANRLRPASREAAALEALLHENGHTLAAGIPERSIYQRLAGDGLSIFDVQKKTTLREQDHWMPLLEGIEDLWSAKNES